MNFIKDLEESRLTKNSNNIKALTYTDCCERVFLSLLIVELLRQYPKYASNASNYAKKTLGKENYSQFRAFSTDLYNFVYYIIGDENALDKLKDPATAKKLQPITSVPIFALNRYLRAVANNTIPQSVSEFLIKIESNLNITNSDYKNIRRNLTNYSKLSKKDRKVIVTKLLFAARAKLRSSDIIDDLSKLVSDNDLETAKVKDLEPVVSVPDLTISSADLTLYRLLVGTNNMMLTKKFLELAKDGKAIPPQMMQAYLPVVEIIDDIVKGGMTYVQLLKSIHNKAKKASK